MSRANKARPLVPHMGSGSLIKGEVFEAEAMESTRAFHHRLARIARARGIYVVSIGDDTPQLVSRYNLDGSPVTIN
jgi:hypothetical protein